MKKARGIGKILASAVVGAVLMGCETGPPPLPDNMAIWNATPREELYAEGEEGALENGESSSEEIEVDLLSFELPDDIGRADINGDSEDSEELVQDAVARFSISPSQTTFDGGAVVYNYVENHVYQIFTAPRNIVDIELEPGETIVAAPAAGDTANFELGTSESYANNRRREHVYIKPLYPGLQTSLVINTDRRTYRFSVRSFEETFMPVVSFNYPMDLAEAQRERQIQERNEVRINGNITDMDFNYEVVPMSAHRPAWMPSLVFNDGQNTYLYMVSGRRAAYAPALFSIEGDERILVNYRVAGDYFVVPRVLDKMELILDINAGNIVTIQRIEE